MNGMIRALRRVGTGMACAAAGLIGGCAGGAAPADMIVRNALVTTMDDGAPEASAFAVRDGVFAAVGDEGAVMRLRGAGTVVIDAGGRRVIPGLNDSHIHAVRGGRFWNLETRWEGVASLEEGLGMIRREAARTPPGHWVRVIGGWSAHQFREKRMPTIAELNAAAPETPVFVLYLYSRGFLNRAGVAALGLDETTPPPVGGRYEFVDGGAILHAEPNPTILYQTIARLPQLSEADQANSTRQFYRELNRLGLTSVVDAGGGGHLYPRDYAGSRALAESGELPLRVSFYLFPQRPGDELAEFEAWLATSEVGTDLHSAFEHGFELQGAGEFLVWSAGDFENFLAPRPDLRPGWREQMRAVATLLAQRGWPLRVHATYGESVDGILDVLEEVFAEHGAPARWAIDHGETMRPDQIERIRRMGGGVAVQSRMAFAGEDFVARYGADRAQTAPPLRALVDSGVALGAGTDATRVSSYNPWVALSWMVTGRTVGGLTLYPPEQRLTRAEALRLYTVGSAWFSGEEDVKGRIAPGQFADFAVLRDDYMTVEAERIAKNESVLTVVGGRVVFSTPGLGFPDAPALERVSPGWSPVADR
jgi:predicted amidohydrolase YtcJ